MPKEEPTKEKQVEEAIDDVRDCMMRNIKAAALEASAKIEKAHARHALLKAKERLNSLEHELMSL